MANEYILGLSMIHSTKNEKKNYNTIHIFESFDNYNTCIISNRGKGKGGGGGGLGGHDPLDFPKIPFTTSIFDKNIKN